MGYYIQTPKRKCKASQLVNLYCAKIIKPPQSFNEIPDHRALVCVIENLMFDSAGYCYSEREYKVFAHNDGRIKTWLLMDKLLVQELSGYIE